MSNAKVSHTIATTAAKTILIDSMDPDFNWTETMVTLESAVAIVVSYIATTKAPPGKAEAFATEIMNSMTEAAHTRVIQILRQKAGQ